ncbi:response regulator [Pseudomonas sp. RIT-PI-S]|uniref:response regulator n=1 Tax=Pseudomonas sp. RIT-PI-S TaxID=3035295 RepID=UPI0021D8C9B9|nr:response regulator [Pseudomonas sp. RIT-PI-S]
MIKQTALPKTAHPVVLIVEDDELLRELLVEVISELGCTVRAVGTADDGLCAIQQHRDVGLVLTDVMTPGSITGLQLATALHTHWPELPVIVTSGYSAQLFSDLPPSACFLAKPWSLDAILSLVQGRLNGE